MSRREEYQIPGMPDVGTPGNRKPFDANAIKATFADLNAGKGVVIDQNGVMSPGSFAKRTDDSGNPLPITELRNIRTSMSDNPYQSANPRRDSLMPPLAGKRVVIVGLGGGAPIPIELLKCGVSEFHLVDHDLLEAGNAVRHPCPRKYFGLPKVEAVKLHMHELAGEDVQIFTHQIDVFEHRADMAAMIGQSDLLVVATDTEASRHYLNEIAVEVHTPAVYVGMFEGGSGGEIFAALEGEACYTCLAEHLDRKEFLSEYRKATKKGDCSSARDTLAMPGLGIDQGILAYIAARKSVDILLLGAQHSLPPVGKNWILFSIFGVPRILESSLSSTQLDPPRHPGCFACGET